MKNKTSQQTQEISTINRYSRTFLASLILVWQFAPFAVANPIGEELIQGEASFERSGSTLEITQESDNVIINWEDFSIDAGELTQFNQSVDMAALNRVISANPSEIYGTLQADGQIFLINPNGILVGPSGAINVGEFTASTLDVSNADFLNGGDLTFTGDSTAGITNLGTVSSMGGNIILIAQEIDNAGTLSAEGTVALASGTEVILSDSNDSNILVVAGSYEGDEAAISNSGVIEATSAELNVAGGNIYALAINNTGVIRATGIAEQDGRIYLTATGTIENSGTLEASDADSTGGTIHVEGDLISITGDVIATGTNGGGEILIGGEVMGQDPSFKNATAVSISDTATIDASATENGDGGRLIVFSEDNTAISGQLSATGGAESGNGGFIETSGKKSFAITGTPDATAANGEGGEWLIDPNNIEIVSGSTDANVTGSPTYTSTDDTAQIGATNIQNALNAGTSVTITTTTSGANTQDGDITVSAPIAKTSGASATLTLSAHDDIFVNQSIQSIGGNALNLVFTADSDTSGAGSITISALVSTNGGTITTTGVNYTQNSAIFTHGADGGNISITQTGTVTISDDIGTSGSLVTGTVTIDSGGTINLGGEINTDGDAITLQDNVILQNASVVINTNSSNGGNITVNGTIEGNSAAGQGLQVESGSGAVSITGNIGATTELLSLSIDGGSIDLGGNIGNSGGTTSGVEGTTALTADAGGIDFSGTHYQTDGTQTYTATSAYTLTGGATTTFKTSTDTITFNSQSITMGEAANLSIDSAGAAVTTQAITGTAGGVAETVTINTGNASAGAINVGAIGAGGNVGAITLEAGTDSLTGSGTITGSGLIDLDADSAITIGGLVTSTGGSNVDINTAGTLSINGGIDTGNAGADNAGTLTLATSGITLTGDSQITTNGTGTNDTALTVGVAINDTAAGTNSLTINAGLADVSLNAIGTTTRVGTLSVIGNDITIAGDVEATAVNISATTNGGDADSVTLTGTTIDANSGDVFISSDDITFGTAITSTGATGTTKATIVGDSQASTITIGNAGSSEGNLAITEASLNTIASTFSDVFIGSEAGDGTINGEAQVDQAAAIVVDVADGTLNFSNASLTLRGGTSTVTVTDAIDTTGAADANVTLEGATVNIDNNISTDSGNVTVTGAAEINGAVTIDTENGGDSVAGDVSFSSTIVAEDGTGDTLTINTDGTTDGAVTITGNVGDNTTGNDLDGFTITQGNQVDLASVFVDAGNIAIEGANIDLNGTAYNAEASGSITFTGAVDLDSTGTITIQTEGADADDITFTSTIDDTGSDSTLVLNTRDGVAGAPGGEAGEVDLQGTVGATNAIGVINISGADDVSLDAATYTSAGAITITSDTVTLDGGAITTTITSGGDAGEDITIAGTIDDAANDTDLSLDAGTSGDITLSSAVGGTNAIDGFEIKNGQDVSLAAVTVDGASGSDTIDIGTGSAIDGTLTLTGDLSTDGAAGGNATGNIDINASGTIDINVATTLTLDTANAGGDNSGSVTLRGGGTLQSNTAWEDGLTISGDDGGGGTDATISISGVTLNNLDHLDVSGAAFTIGDTTLGDGGNNGNVGLDVNVSGDFTVNGDISTAGDTSNNAGAIDLAGVAGNVILNEDGANDDGIVTISTNATTNDADVTIGAVRDGATNIGLTVDAGGADITFSSTIGDDDAIGALTLTGNDIDISGGDMDVTGATIVANNPGADAESVTWSGRTLDANGGDVFVSSDSITFGTSTISTGGSDPTKFTIVGDTAASTITVDNGAGSDGNLEVSEADLATIGTTFTDIIIGMDDADGTVGGEAQADQTGAVTINANDGTLNLALTTDGSSLVARANGAGGAVTVSSAISTTGGDMNVELQGTTINLDNNISTDAADIIFTGAVEVNAAVTLDTETGANHAGGNVSFSSTVVAQDGTTDSLAINVDGSGTNDGTVTITGAVGDDTDANDLDGFSITGASQVDVNDIYVDNADIFISSNNIDLNGSNYKISNGTGDDTIEFDGNTDLNAATVTVTGGGNAGDTISFTDDSALNGATGVVNSEASARNLVIVGGSADVTFDGSIGTTSNLASLDINTSGTVSFDDDVTTTGNIALDGATGAIDLTAAIDYDFTAGGDLDFSGTSGVTDSANITSIQLVGENILVGAMTIDNVNTTQLDIDLDGAADGGARTLTLSGDISVGNIILTGQGGDDTVTVNADVDVATTNGNNDLDNTISSINLAGAGSNIFTAAGGDLSLAAVTDSANITTLQLIGENINTAAITVDNVNTTQLDVDLDGGADGGARTWTASGDVNIGNVIVTGQNSDDIVSLQANVDIVTSNGALDADNALGSIDLAGAGTNILTAAGGDLSLAAVTDSASIIELELNGENINTTSTITLDNNTTAVLDVNLDGAADGGARTWTASGDIAVGSVTLDGQAGDDTVSLAANVDITATGTTLDLDNTIASIDLAGVGSNIFTATTDLSLAALTDSANITEVELNAENITTAAITLDNLATTLLDVNLDGGADGGARTWDANADITAGQIDLTGQGSDDILDLAADVDITASNTTLDLNNTMGTINISGAGTNILTATTDLEVAAVTDSANVTELELNGENITFAGATLDNGGTPLIDINLDGGADGGARTLTLTGDITTNTITVDGQNADDIIDLAAGVDITVSGGALDLDNNIATINLSGASSTNILTASTDITLAAVTDSASITELELNGENINTAAITIDNNTSAILDINLDGAADGGARAWTASGDVSVGQLTLDGQGGDDTVTLNANVDLSTTGGNLDLNNTIASIDLAGVGSNILTATGDIELAAVTDSANITEFELNGENITTAAITINNLATSLLDVNLDGAADGGVRTWTATGDIAVGQIDLDGQGNDDILDLAANVDIDATNTTLDLDDNLGSIVLSGAGSNILSANTDLSVDVITDSANITELELNGENINTQAITLDNLATTLLDINLDNLGDNGVLTWTASGDVAAGQIDLTGIGGNDVVSVGADVDINATNTTLDLANSIASIDLAGAGSNIFTATTDMELAAITDSANITELELNGENITTAAITLDNLATTLLDVNLDGAADGGARTWDANADIAAGQIDLTGQGSDDILDLAADVDITASNTTLDLNNTMGTINISGAGTNILTATTDLEVAAVTDSANVTELELNGENITLAGAILDNGGTPLLDINLDAGADGGARTLAITGDVNTHTLTVDGQNANDLITLGANVDLTTTSSAIDLDNNIASIDLNGAGTNIITSAADLTLAAVTDSANVTELELNGENINTAAITLDNLATTILDINLDGAADGGARTWTASGDVASGSIVLDGQGGDDLVSLQANVDINATNTTLDLDNTISSIDLAGAGSNILTATTDLSLAAITDSANITELELNGENITTVAITLDNLAATLLDVNLDGAADGGARTWDANADIASGQIDLTGQGSDDILDLAADVDITASNTTLDLNNTMGTINISGAGSNILTATTDLEVAAVTDSAAVTELTLNGENITFAGATFDQGGNTTVLDINLDGGADGGARTLSLTGDISTHTLEVDGQNADDIIDLAANVDITASNSAVDLDNNIATINLSGASSTNIITASAADITLAAVTDGASITELELNGENINTAAITLDANTTAILDINLDGAADGGARTWTASGDVSVGQLTLDGVGGDDLVSLQANVDLTTTGSGLDLNNTIASIDLAGAGTNILTAAGDLEVAAITDSANITELELNGENITTAAITLDNLAATLLDVNLDGAADGGARTWTATGDITAGQVDLTGQASDDILDLAADVDITASNTTLDLNNTMGTINISGAGSNILTATTDLEVAAVTDSAAVTELTLNGENITFAGATFDQGGNTTVLDINLDGGADGGARTLSLTGDISTHTLEVDGQNADDIIDLGANVDITASNSAVDLDNNIATINLSGAGTNIITATAADITLAAVTDSATITELELNAENINTAAITLDNNTTALLDINLDGAADGGARAWTASGDISVGQLTLDGVGGDDTVTLNANVDITTTGAGLDLNNNIASIDLAGAGTNILTAAGDLEVAAVTDSAVIVELNLVGENITLDAITFDQGGNTTVLDIDLDGVADGGARTLTLNGDISTHTLEVDGQNADDLISLGANVDITTTNSAIDLDNNIASIDLAGAGTNVFTSAGDLTLAAVTDSANITELELNGENINTAAITLDNLATTILDINLDGAADGGARTWTASGDVASGSIVLDGQGGDDLVSLQANVDINATNTTLDLNNTIASIDLAGAGTNILTATTDLSLAAITDSANITELELNGENITTAAITLDNLATTLLDVNLDGAADGGARAWTATADITSGQVDLTGQGSDDLLDLAANVDITASNTTLDLNNTMGTINISGAGTNILTATTDLEVAAVTDSAAVTELTLIGENITLAGATFDQGGNTTVLDIDLDGAADGGARTLAITGDISTHTLEVDGQNNDDLITLGANVDLTTTSSAIDLDNNIASIDLNGAGSNVLTSAGDLTLAAVTDSANITELELNGENINTAAITLDNLATTILDINLDGAADGGARTWTASGDVASGSIVLDGQGGDDLVSLQANVDINATNTTLDLNNTIASIDLAGAGSNILTATTDMELAAITDSANITELELNGENITTAAITLDNLATTLLDVNLDGAADGGARTWTATGDITAGQVDLTGQGSDDILDLAANVDITASNTTLDLNNTMGTINISGAGTNILTATTDLEVAAVTDSAAVTELTLIGENITFAGATFDQGGNTTVLDIDLDGAADGGARTLAITGDISTHTLEVDGQNADDIIDLAANVDITASNSAVDLDNNIATINLSGAGTNIITATAADITLAAVTDSATITELELNGENINTAAITLDANTTALLDINLDGAADGGARAWTASGDVSVGQLTLDGVGGDDTVTLNADVDLTTTGSGLDLNNNIASINLAGAGSNILTAAGDLEVAAITDSANITELELNGENITTAAITLDNLATTLLDVNLDGAADGGARTWTATADITSGQIDLTGQGGDDILDLAANVDITASNTTLDLNNTMGTINISGAGTNILTATTDLEVAAVTDSAAVTELTLIGENITFAGATFDQGGNTTVLDIDVDGAADGGARTLAITGDVTTHTLEVAGQNADDLVTLGANVDLTTTNGSIDMTDNIASIDLAGAGTNIITSAADVTLAAITDSANITELEINGENITTAGIVIDNQVSTIIDINLDGAADGGARTWSVTGDVSVGSLDLTGQGGDDLVDLQANVDITTTNAALDLDTTIASVNLSGAGTNILTAAGDLSVAAVTDSAVITELTLIGENINLAGATFDQGGNTTVLDIDLDGAADGGARTLTVTGDISTHTLEVDGQNANDLISLGANVDITTTNSAIDLDNNIASIDLAGAGTNILTSAGDITLAAVTDSANITEFELNGENINTVAITLDNLAATVLDINLDGAADGGARTWTATGDVASGSIDLTGVGGDDLVSLGANVDINATNTTLDLNNTIASIDLAGAGSNILTATTDMELAAITDSANITELELNGENITTAAITLDNLNTTLLDVNLDGAADGGARTWTATGDIASATIVLDGQGSNDMLDLAANVDVTATNGALDLDNTMGSINISGAGSNTLSATNNVSLANITDTAAVAALNITSTGGTISLNTITMDNSGTNLNVTTNGGATTLNSNVTLAGGTFTMNGGGAVVISDTLTVNTGSGGIIWTNNNVSADNGGLDLTLIGNGGIELDLIDNNAGAYLDDITATSSGTTKLDGNITTTGNVDFSAAKTIQLTDDIIITTESGNGFVNLDGGNVDGGQSLTINSGSGAVTLSNVGANAELTNITISGGDLTMNGEVHTSGTLDITASSEVKNTNKIAADILKIAASGAITLENNGNTINELNTITAGGNISIFDSSGGIKVTDKVNAGGSNVLLRTVGNFTLAGGSQVSGNLIQIEANGGAFINDSNDQALNPGSRFIVWSDSYEGDFKNGGLTGFVDDEISYNADPYSESNAASSDNAFYFAQNNNIVTNSKLLANGTIQAPSSFTTFEGLNIVQTFSSEDGKTFIAITDTGTVFVLDVDLNRNLYEDLTAFTTTGGGVGLTVVGSTDSAQIIGTFTSIAEAIAELGFTAPPQLPVAGSASGSASPATLAIAQAVAGEDGTFTLLTAAELAALQAGDTAAVASLLDSSDDTVTTTILMTTSIGGTTVTFSMSGDAFAALAAFSANANSFISSFFLVPSDSQTEVVVIKKKKK